MHGDKVPGSALRDTMVRQDAVSGDPSSDQGMPVTLNPWRASRILLGIVMVIGGIAAASALLDSRMAIHAEELSASSVAWGWFLSDIGSSGWMFTASAAVAMVGVAMGASRVAERAGFLFATLCTESLAVQAVKHLVGRARPYAFGTFGPYHFDMLSLTDALASFPSGHTATAFSMALALTLMAPRYRVALFTAAIGVALSRIVVQAHYVSDIMAGSLFGIAAALLVARLFAQHGLVFELGGEHRLTLKGAATTRVPHPFHIL